VGIDTFTQFAEFVYGGDYNVAMAVDPQKNEAAPGFGVASAPSDWEDWTSQSKMKPKTKKKRDGSGVSFRTLADLRPTVEKLAFPVLEVSEIGRTQEYDYSQAFSHVHLYLFAEKYQVNSLKDLTLQKLFDVLSDTRFDSSRTGDLCQMIQHVYEKTPELVSKKEPLRNMLSYFVAYNFENLTCSEEFQKMLTAGGQIVNDMSQVLTERINKLEGVS
jgi:hypothetical protein